MSSSNTGNLIARSSIKKGVEATISDEREVFNASTSLVTTPLPKKEAASPAIPPPLSLPISGESIILAVYLLGILNATIIPIINPIPAALYNDLRI